MLLRDCRTFHGVSYRTLLLLLAGVGVFAPLACGGSSTPASPTPASPTPAAPTTTVGPRVTATVTPVPAPLRVRGASLASGCLIGGEVTFSETAGLSGRLTELIVTITNGAGDATTVTTKLDVPLKAGGPVTQPFSYTIDALFGQAPFQLQVSANGVDEAGTPFVVPAVVVPATVVMPALPPPPPAPDVTVVAAGDIARCNQASTAGTARLLDQIPGSVLTLGDHTYPTGSPESFRDCYGPTWGRHQSRTFAAPGNHDWEVASGAPYFGFFGLSAGPPGVGFYGFTLGGWRLLSLNSNVPAHEGSAQYEWVRNELATNSSSCTLAYWHHPVFSSGPNGNFGQMRDVWRLLQSRSVELVLTAHDHTYERFAPQDADGRSDPLGIRQFVVGTGGGVLYRLGGIQPNSELFHNQTWGVLKLTLRASNYAWDFLPIEGQSFRDFGTGVCR